MARAGVGEQQQNGLDATIHVEIFGDAELGEHGVGVLLHRPFGQAKRAGHERVRRTGGHLLEHLAFTWSEERHKRSPSAIRPDFETFS